MAFNRELSQFANYLELDAGANYIGIATNTNDANVGIGSATPESKLTVTGDAKISGVVTATSFDGALVGNADSASVLETARTISLSGDLGGSVSFDGSQDITITATVQPDSVDLGTDTVGNYVRELQAVGGSGIAVIDGTGEGTLAQVELTDTGVTPGTTGSSTEIPVITVDSKGRITSVSTTDVGTTLTVEGDSGTAAIDLLTETIKFAGGANITSTVATGGSAYLLNRDYSVLSDQVTTDWQTVDANASLLMDSANNRLRIRGKSFAAYAELTTVVGTEYTFTGVFDTSEISNVIIRAQDGSGTGGSILGAEQLNSSGTSTFTFTATSTTTSITVTISNSGSTGNVYLPSVGVSGGSGVDTVSYALDSDISLNTVTATEFNTGAVGSAIRVSSDTISGPSTLTLDPAGVGDNTGKVVIAGDLQVDGTQTIVNSTTITVDDKNISLADGATNDAEADGGGITIQSGEGDKTFQFEANGDNFGSSENMNLADGKTYKIDNVDILSQTALGDSVVESSLTSVGNLEQLNVLGIVTAATFVATSGTFDLTGNVTGNLDGIAENASGILTARDFSISGDATAPAVSFDGRQNVDLNLTLADTGVVSSAYGSSTKIPRIVVDSKGRITGVTELTGDLLEKAGGTMTGAIQLGVGSAAPGFIAADDNTSVTGTTFASSYDSWRMMHLDEFKSSGKHYIEFTIDNDNYSPSTASITLGVVEENNLDTVSKRRSELGRFGTAIGFRNHGTLWVGTTETAWGFIPAPVFAPGDVIGVLLDMDARTLQFSKNGTLLNKVIDLPGTGAYTFGSSLYTSAGTTEVTYQLDTVANLPAGYEIISAGGPASTLNVDGTATFVGNVTAATAPTAPEHLANKGYIDSLDSANSADIAANAAAIAAEEAARIAADNTLTTNLAAEEAARIAADATKLPLAGGTMTGALGLGSGPSGATWGAVDSNVTVDGNSITFGDAQNWHSAQLDPLFNETSGKYYYELTVLDPGTYNAVHVGIVPSDQRTMEAGQSINGPVNIRLENGQVYAYNGLTGVADQYATIGDFGASGNVVGVLVDADNDRISFTVNGTLITRGTTSAFSLNGMTGNTTPNRVLITVFQDAVIEVNMEPSSFPAGYTAFPGAASGGAAITTIGVDGTATFGGLVSASTAPTAAEHLTNKAYVDAKAQTNADAIAAVVGGAPELLNTLDELAQALSDDENFATTVTNQIATETAARTAADTAEETARISADNTLQANIDAEEAARIAADDTKLPLAGGTMTGALQVGTTGGPSVTFSGTQVAGQYSVIFDFGSSTSNQMSLDNANIKFMMSNDGVGFSWGPDTPSINTTARYVKVTNRYAINEEFTVTLGGHQLANSADIPWTLHSAWSSEVGQDVMESGSVTLVQGYGSKLDVDGTAEFGGLVSASAAPTADEHLTNKLYVDGLTSANTTSINTNATNIAANAAAISAEEAARIAADALKLDLAGGQMSGDLQVGQGTGPNPSLAKIGALGGISDLTVSGAAGGWSTFAASLAKTMANGGKHYYEVFLEANFSGGWVGVTGEASDSDIDVSGPSGNNLEAIAVSDDTSHTKHLVGGNLYDGAATTTNGVTAGAGDVVGILLDASGDAPWTIGYTVNGVDAGSESIDYPWSDTYRPVLSIGAGDVTFRFNETDIENLPAGYSAWVPTAPSVNLKTDGTASFAGNVTAALAPSSGDHLTNKTYVDSSVSTANTNLTAAIAAEEAARIAADTTETNARIAADTTLTNDLATETAARIAADATKLPLAGGELSGNLTIAGDAPYTPEEVEIGNHQLAYTGLFSGSGWFAVRAWASDPVTGSGLSFNPITVTTSMTFPATLSVHHINPAELVLNQGEPDEFVITPPTGATTGFDLVAQGLPLPYVLKSIIFRGGASGTSSSIQSIAIDGVGINAITTQPATTITLGVDGTATFSGHVTAATAPTSGDHLTNKTYVDAKAQANADAIEAVVGGAPELLNTLNELAQAISDDEAFATTVTNQIAAETTARQASDVTLQTNIDAEAATRLANDSTLQANIAAEEAARIAADATKLPLAGGTMTGAINLGTGAMDLSAINPRGSTPVSGTHDNVWDGDLSTFVELNHSYNATVFDDMTVTSTLRIYARVQGEGGATARVVLNSLGSNNGGLNDPYTSTITSTAAWVDIPVIARHGSPFTVRSIGFNEGGSTINKIKLYAVEIDGVIVTGVAGGAAVLGVDGSATFGGNVTAALAPSSGDHLANKTYVDGEVTSANTALTAAIAAEEAARIAADTTETNARIAADNVLTTNLANEITNRQAGDALKLDLAGGTMSGALVMGGSTSSTNTFRTDDGSGNVTFSNGDRTYTSGSGDRGFTTTATLGSGKYYWEISSTDLPNLGVTVSRSQDWQGAIRHPNQDGTYGFQPYYGHYAVGGWAPNNSNAIQNFTQAAFANDGFVNYGFTFNGETGEVRVYVNGVIQSTNFPVTVTTGSDYFIHAGHGGTSSSSGSVTIAFAEADLAYPIPAGFTTLDSIGTPSTVNITPSGAATFGGLISAATAPTSGSHLTNKTYVDASSSTLQASIDAEAATRLANDNTLQANIDAEEAARIAADSAEATARADADTVLTNDLATETAARIAADATKLPLAGGTMTGDVVFGEGPAPVPTGSVAFTGSWKVFLQSATNAMAQFIDNDFTVEFWILHTATEPQNSRWMTTNTGGSWYGNTFAIGEGPDGTIRFNRFTSTVPYTRTPNTWQHIAYTRESGTERIFINGVLAGSAATIGSYTETSLTVGGRATSGGQAGLAGNLSNVRIVKGTALYTDNFTVPTEELTAISGTSLLCCQSDTDPTEAAVGSLTNSSDVYPGFAAVASSLNPGITGPGPSVPLTTVSVDGTATFAGNVTAATAPTADEHLTNKAYVDAKAQTNADAIAAVVGGAPELLNTLDELAQALSDDENFATTVTNQIAAETTARTDADTVLTNSIAAEEAARIAADATKLPLAGGVMTGAINLGASADITVGPFTPAEGVSLYGSGEPTVTLTTGSGTIESITIVADGNNSEWFALYIDDVIVDDASLGQYVTGAGFNGNVGDRAFDSNANSKAQGAGNSTMVFTPATPIPYTSKVQVKIGPYNTVTMVNGEAGGLSTLGVDGTATFAGNVTAATAPTAAGHLANKAYIDAIDSSNSADIAANTAAIAAEEAARIAADNTKLALAGGTMTGAIDLGQVGTPLIQTQNFSADLTGGFDQPASNAFDGAVNVDGAPLARTTGNAVVVTLPINPAITVTESVTIYGETNYAPGLMNVSVTVDGVKSEANGVGNIHTFNVSGSLTEITVQNNGSGGRTYVDGFAVDGVLLADPGVTAPGGSAGPASTIGIDGTATFTDKVTVGSLEIDGALTDVNDATGNNGYILKSVGTGVEWIDILSILPQSRTTGNFTATAGQTVFTFTYNVGYLDVFVNGVKLSTDRGEFNADNGTTVTLTESLFAGDHVEMISFNTQGVGAGSVNSTADLTDVALSGTTQNDILTYDGSKFVNGQTLNLSGAVTAQSFSGVGLELTGLNASELSTGTVSAARLGSGTADGTTFLRGDNTWAVVDSTTLKDSNNVTRVAATTSGATVTGDLDLGTGTLNAGDVVLTGNLIVNGTTTTLNTAELAVEDSNITVAKNATSGAEADGAGLTVAGANATLTYAAAGDRFAFNKSVAASTFIGDLLGNVTGNANTATALATPRTIGGVSFDGSANIDLPGVNTTGNQNTSGNAATATALQTARTIGGVSFDGSANINLPGVNTAGNQDTSGNAATATSASKVSLTNGSGTFYPALVPGGTGAKDVVSNTGLAFNTESGLLTVSGRVAAQDFNATSDITLKDNVSIIDNALEMINNLDGISWNWKNTGKASLGVSAQNVETVAPELVGQGEHKSVNYNGLVGVLIEAVKTLSAEVEMLKATKSDRRVRKSA